MTASAPAPTMATEVKQVIDQCIAVWNETDPAKGQKEGRLEPTAAPVSTLHPPLFSLQSGWRWG